MDDLFGRACEVITRKHKAEFCHKLEVATQDLLRICGSSPVTVQSRHLFKWQQLRLEAQHGLEKELWAVWGQPAQPRATRIVKGCVKQISTVDVEMKLQLVFAQTAKGETESGKEEDEACETEEDKREDSEISDEERLLVQKQLKVVENLWALRESQKMEHIPKILNYFSDDFQSYDVSGDQYGRNELSEILHNQFAKKFEVKKFDVLEAKPYSITVKYESEWEDEEQHWWAENHAVYFFDESDRICEVHGNMVNFANDAMEIQNEVYYLGGQIQYFLNAYSPASCSIS